MSIYRSFVSVRLTFASLAFFILNTSGAAQSLDDYASRMGDASLAGKVVPNEPFSDCGDPLMNGSHSCHENQVLLDASSSQFTFHAPTSAGTVSADALRHPLSGKALRSLQKAQDLIRAGDHMRAIRQLREAVKISSAEPYAHSLLGQEHLRLREAEEAIPELRLAVGMLPSSIADRSNLGLALLMTGETRRAEQELRDALHLDPHNPQTQLVLGVAVLENGSDDREGVEYLNAAGHRLSTAHVVLAAFYAFVGRLDAAEQEARAFLGPKGSSDPVVVRNWVNSLAQESTMRSGFVYALIK